MMRGMRKFVIAMLTSPAPRVSPPRPWWETTLLGLVALAITGGIFTYHWARFTGLGTTSDLYTYVQLATSWLDGRFLQDNFFGRYLAVHTYFLCPLLALVAYPFGAPGLLFTLGVAAAAGLVALDRILRLLGMPSLVALVAAIGLTVMPLSLHVYQDDLCGFHIELLIPALALWLAWFLLRQRWFGSLACGLALVAMKEDAGLVVIAVAGAVAGEDLLRAVGEGGLRAWRRGVNAPAWVLIGFALLAMPALLYIIKVQPAGGYFAMSGFDKVQATGVSAVTNQTSLYRHFFSHLDDWLLSGPVTQGWIALGLATFGLALFRPHLVPLGLSLTLTAWLVHGDLMWPPRFAPVLAFAQVIAVLALASIYRVATQLWQRPRWGRTVFAVVGLASSVVAVGCWRSQLRLAPNTGEVYRLAPKLAITPVERATADQLFARYRAESRPSEPVIASNFLFRYAHDRNLFWYNRLKDREQPVWILWDQEDIPLSLLEVYLKTDAGRCLEDYELLGRNGRFLLYRAWDNREPADLPRAALPGDEHGQVRLELRFQDGPPGSSEPVLSLGEGGEGELFFVEYLPGHRLVLGLHRIGGSTYRSDPIAYDPTRRHVIELFSGSLLPQGPRAEARPAAALAYQETVLIHWDGQEVLSALAPACAIRPESVYVGVNRVRSSRAVSRFSGEIHDARRGGLPAGVRDQSSDRFGAVALQVRLGAGGKGDAEPLVVVGVPGEAILAYLRQYGDGRVRVGVEFWSFGLLESELLEVDRSGVTEVIVSLPVFFPPLDDPRWGDVPRADQQRWRTRAMIRVNGVWVLDREISYPVPREFRPAIVANPVGGSIVTAPFSGVLVGSSRMPLGRLAPDQAAAQPVPAANQAGH